MRSTFILTLFPLMIWAQDLIKRASPPTECNGWPELCDRSFGNMTILGAHDSPFTSTLPLALARDQDLSVLDQLNGGVRMIQGQFHYCKNNNSMCLCHNQCNQTNTFDAGLALNTLQTIKFWLDINPNEVVSLLFTNGDYLDVKTNIAPVYEAAGLSDIAFIPPSWPLPRTGWPTLSNMIANETRVVIFIDYYEPLFNSNTSVNFILNEFDAMGETPFTQTTNFYNGSVDRISGPLSVANHTYLMNAVMDISGPDSSFPWADTSINCIDFLLSLVQNTTGNWGGYNPSVVLVDFEQYCDNGPLALVNYLNGLGNTTAVNSSMNSTSTSGVLSVARPFGLQGPMDSGMYYTSLCGSVLFTLCAIAMLV